jgi:hypothetical protein
MIERHIKLRYSRAPGLGGSTLFFLEHMIYSVFSNIRNAGPCID